MEELSDHGFHSRGKQELDDLLEESADEAEMGRHVRDVLVKV